MMFKTVFLNVNGKELSIYVLILLIYSSIGLCRSFSSFLFHQIDLPDSDLVLDNDEKTWIASALGMLSPVGALIGGFLSDAIGRKKSMFLMFVPFLLSWFTIGLSKSYVMLFVGNLILGIGLGMVPNIITYLSELSSAKYRGVLLSMIDVSMNFGVIICNVSMYFLNWHLVSFIFFTFYTVAMLLTLILPESPVWLYSKGKIDEAMKHLCFLRNTTPENLREEIAEMEKSNISKQTKTTSLFIILRNCIHAWRQIFIAVLLFALVMNAGHFIIISYTIIILDHFEVPFDSATIALIYSVVSFVGCLTTPFFIHNFKRKTMLTVSSLGMGLSMLTIAVYEEIFLYQEEKPCAWIVPIAFCSFIFFSNIGAVPVCFMIGAELFPMEVRGALQGIFGCFICIYWTLALKIYPAILFAYGIKVLIWLFSGNAFLLTLFAVFILPETKGKTLNEIQEQYFSRTKMSNGEV